MSAEVWAAQVTLHSAPSSHGRAHQMLSHPPSAQGRDLASVRACDWLRATLPSSHWSREATPTGAGDRNSSGRRALVPCPCAPYLLTAHFSSPFPSLRHKTGWGEWPESEETQETQWNIWSRCEANGEREGHCRNAVQHLNILYPALVSVVEKLNRAGDYFTFDTC